MTVKTRLSTVTDGVLSFVDVHRCAVHNLGMEQQSQIRDRVFDMMKELARLCDLAHSQESWGGFTLC